MNVDDIEVSEADSQVENKLVAIFQRQTELLHKYHPIEKANGLLLSEEVPLNIHDRRAQSRMKDMTWRVVEELTEATEALEIHTDIRTHFQEELIDGLHFLVELIIVVGITPGELSDNTCMAGEGKDPFDEIFMEAIGGRRGILADYDEMVPSVYRVIHQLGRAMNCLKNKPWKQTHMLTDVPKFKGYLFAAFTAYVDMLSIAGFDAQSAYIMYLKKNSVNLFRQRSKY